MDKLADTMHTLLLDLQVAVTRTAQDEGRSVTVAHATQWAGLDFKGWNGKHVRVAVDDNVVVVYVMRNGYADGIEARFTGMPHSVIAPVVTAYLS